jgi:hypothetical protein
MLPAQGQVHQSLTPPTLLPETLNTVTNCIEQTEENIPSGYMHGTYYKT